jgi:hypothetical protein
MSAQPEFPPGRLTITDVIGLPSDIISLYQTRPHALQIEIAGAADLGELAASRGSIDTEAAATAQPAASAFALTIGCHLKEMINLRGRKAIESGGDHAWFLQARAADVGNDMA